jgi:hypothetical protein
LVAVAVFEESVDVDVLLKLDGYLPCFFYFGLKLLFGDDLCFFDVSFFD